MIICALVKHELTHISATVLYGVTEVCSCYYSRHCWLGEYERVCACSTLTGS